jgi:hypothetical protein
VDQSRKGRTASASRAGAKCGGWRQFRGYAVALYMGRATHGALQREEKSRERLGGKEKAAAAEQAEAMSWARSLSALACVLERSS